MDEDLDPRRENAGLTLQGCIRAATIYLLIYLLIILVNSLR